jgi:hypothetical protein
VTSPVNAGDDSAPPDQWAAAVDRYRDVAKWLVGSFGATGAVIAGTAPLSALGGLRPHRGGYVVAGGVTALAGVSFVLAATVAVLVPRAVFAHQLVAHKRSWQRRAFTALGSFEDLLARHPESLLPPGIATLGELGQATENLRQSALDLSARAASLAQGPAREAAERAAKAMAGTLATHQRASRELLSLAGYQAARARFNQATAVVLAGGLLTAAGLGLVLYGTTGAR